MNRFSKPAIRYRLLQRNLLIGVTTICSIVLCHSLVAQEQPAEKLQQNTIERIADNATISLVLASQPQVLENVGQLLRDVGKEELIPFLPFPFSNLESHGLSVDQSLVFNAFEKRFDPDSLLVDIKDRAAFLKTLKATDEQLNSKLPFKLSKKPTLLFSSFLWAAGQGDSVVLGKTSEYVQAVIDRDQQFPSKLTNKTREILNRCDIGLMVNVQKTGEKESRDKWVNDLKEDAGKDDAPTVELLGQAMTCARRLSTASRYENHELRWETELSFAKNDAISQLIRTRKDDTFSSTAGLPRDGLILSIGFNSNHFKTESAARVFARFFSTRESWSMIPGFRKHSLNYSELYSRMFGNFWRHVGATRLGLYSSSNPDHVGQISLLGVFDARDPDALLQELQDLAHVAYVSEQTDEDAEKLIKQLIAQLGDTKFKVREAASLRLALAGKKAIKYLEAAKQSSDFEVAYRAKRLLRSYHGASKVNVEKVVGDVSFWQSLKPQFQFEETTEKCLNLPCVVVRMTLPESDKQQRLMSSVFGDQWNRIRVVQVGNQFVVMLGSDIKRMEQTVQNVVDSKNPIAKIKQIADRKTDGNPLQSHLSVARLNNVLFHDEPESLIDNPGDDLTSIGFDFEERRWLIDLFMPGSELKVIVDNPRMSVLR